MLSTTHCLTFFNPLFFQTSNTLPQFFVLLTEVVLIVFDENVNSIKEVVFMLNFMKCVRGDLAFLLLEIHNSLLTVQTRMINGSAKTMREKEDDVIFQVIIEHLPQMVSLKSGLPAQGKAPELSVAQLLSGKHEEVLFFQVRGHTIFSLGINNPIQSTL